MLQDIGVDQPEAAGQEDALPGGKPSSVAAVS